MAADHRIVVTVLLAPPPVVVASSSVVSHAREGRRACPLHAKGHSIQSQRSCYRSNQNVAGRTVVQGTALATQRVDGRLRTHLGSLLAHAARHVLVTVNKSPATIYCNSTARSTRTALVTVAPQPHTRYNPFSLRRGPVAYSYTIRDECA